MENKINLNTLKKVLLIISLSAVGIACVMLILAIFKVKIFEGIPLRLLLIFCTLALGSAVSINEISIIKQKKVLGSVSLSFLLLSVLFALIIFCSPIFEVENFFNRLTGIFSLFSIFFMMIISLNTKLDRKYIVIQIICYIALCFVDGILSILIGGYDIFSVTSITEIFWILVVVSVGLLITLSVLSTKRLTESDSKNKETITISKVEYEALKKENEALKEEISKLKK